MKKGWASRVWKRAVGCCTRARRGWKNWRSDQWRSRKGEEFPLEEMAETIVNDPPTPEQVQQVTGRPPVVECPDFTYRYAVRDVMAVHGLSEGLAMIHIDDYIANGQDWREACQIHTRNIWV
ncbi:uncharacterized protein EI90DRAFT_3017516 [Cantharellus anzutake]|uniref:uncharacterized protein n=1 Tax=Cantharellus anzutake TaxID=1750568 RepID=UPI001904D3B8|nr:uncharacterized protein EI90DRAFT_3017516 [Cantharellus anzutake]KAF8328927.1 hypothetical protein EI90DRAFT_3017516 [Cantharellus anzutake]